MRASLRYTMLLALLCSGHLPAAAGGQESLSLAWDDCGPFGVRGKQFACDTNDGDRFDLILAVRPPAGIMDFVGFIGVVDFDFQMQTTPSWWDFPGCRSGTDLTVSQVSDLSCPNISDLPFFMAWDWALGVGYPARSRLRVAAAVNAEDAFPLTADSLVALCRVSFSRRSTVGAEACAGCNVPVCIAFTSALLDVVDQSQPRRILTWGSKQFVQWQQPLVCPFVGSPAAPSSWGRLKSLYR